MSIVPVEVGGRRIVYPRTYDRKYYGWFEITRSRVVGGLWMIASALLGLVVHVGFAFVFLFATVYLIVPTTDGHGYDTFMNWRRSRRFRRRGGYPQPGSMLDPTEEHPNPLELVVYELPRLDLTVVRNRMTNRDIVVLEIVGWKDISVCDPLERISRENSFNEVIQELTALEYFSRFSCFSMRREADDTDVWHELEDSSGENLLREYIDAAVDAVYYGTDEEGAAPSTRFFMTMQTRVSSSAAKILQNGGDVRKIPAVDSLMALRDALETIDMSVDIPDEAAVATLLRQLHVPLDEFTESLLAEERILEEKGDEGLDDVPLPLQREAIPTYRVGDNWISFDEGSYHTILMQKRVKVKEPPPGWLDTFYAGGLSDLCVAGLTVDVISKSGAQTTASVMRRYARGRDHQKVQKGSMPTERQEQEHEAALRSFDELDLSEGELATYCLFVIISAGSPEELRRDVATTMKTCRGFKLTLTRVTGGARQLPAFHSAVGLM